MSQDDPCFTEFREANICLQTNGPSVCNCFDDINDFPIAFPDEMRLSFLSAQVYAFPGEPSFCGVANERVCDKFRNKYSCCCQNEVETYRKCLFNKVFVPAQPEIPGVCEDTCSWKKTAAVSEEGGDGGGATIAVIIGVILVLAMAGGGFWFLKRRKQKQGNDGDEAPSGSKKKRRKSLGSYVSYFTKGEKPMQTIEKEIFAPDIERGNDTARSESESPHNSKNGSNIIYDEEESGVSSRQPSVNSRHLSKASQLDKDGRTPNPRLSITKSPSKKDLLRNKRTAIENWVSEKKNGSQRSLEDFLSDDPDQVIYPQEKEDERNKSRSSPNDRKSSSSRDVTKIHDSESKELRRAKSARNNVSQSSVEQEREEMMAAIGDLRRQKRELKERMTKNQHQADELGMMKDETSIHKRNLLLQDSAKMGFKLSQLKETKAHYEGRLKAAANEAKELQNNQQDAYRRIAELEAKNASLAAKLETKGNASFGSPNQPRRRGSGRGLAGDSSNSRPRLERRNSDRSMGSGRGLDGRPRVKRRLSDRSLQKLEANGSTRKLERKSSDRSLRKLEKGYSSDRSLNDLQQADSRQRRRNSGRQLQKSSSDRSLNNLHHSESRVRLKVERRLSDRSLRKLEKGNSSDRSLNDLQPGDSRQRRRNSGRQLQKQGSSRTMEAGGYGSDKDLNQGHAKAKRRGSDRALRKSGSSRDVRKEPDADQVIELGSSWNHTSLLSVQDLYDNCDAKK